MKGKRKRNPGVGIDFKKAKHKVGRKVGKPANETRVEVKSGRLALAAQSLAQDRTGAAVSSRNLTLEELLGQLSHHNDKTRRDALTGLSELLSDHHSSAVRHAGALLDALLPRLADNDAAVRSALLDLFKAPLLPLLAPSALSAFMPMIMAHMTAALTNLSTDVRLDALLLLEALAAAVPHLVSAPQHLGLILEQYATLLSRSNRGRSVKSQALPGLLRVLGSCQRFLHSVHSTAAAPAGGSGGKDMPGGEGEVLASTNCSSSNQQQEGQVQGGELLLASRCNPATSSSLPPLQQLLVQHLRAPSSGRQQQQQQQQQGGAGKGASAGGGGQQGFGKPPRQQQQVGGSGSQQQQQALGLLRAVFGCWAEASPRTLSSAPEADNAAVLLACLQCGLALLPLVTPAAGGTSPPAAGGSSSSGPGGGVLRGAADAVLPALLPVFPVQPARLQPLSASLQQQLARFNLLGLQLLTSLAVALDHSSSSSSRSGGNQHGASSGRQQAQGQAAVELPQVVVGVMTGVLQAASLLPGASADAAANSSTTGTPASDLLHVLRCCEQLLPLLAPHQQAALLGALQQLPARCGGGRRQQARLRAAAAQVQQAVLRRYLLDAPGGLLQDTTTPAAAAAAAGYGSGSSGGSEEGGGGEEVLLEVVCGAPRLLWELGATSPGVSQVLLAMLRDVALLARPGTPLAAALHQTVAPQLAPLLATPLPSQPARGAAAAAAAAAAATGGGPRGSSPLVVLVGPLAKLPPAAQQLGLDLFGQLDALQPPLLKAVALACQLRAYSDAAVIRLLGVVLAGAPQRLPPEAYLQLVATLLAGPGGDLVAPAGAGRAAAGAGAGQQQAREEVQVAAGEGGTMCATTTTATSSSSNSLWAGWGRHMLVVEAVAQQLHRYGGLPLLVDALVPCLVTAVTAVPTTAPAAACSCYSLVRLAALLLEGPGAAAPPAVEPAGGGGGQAGGQQRELCGAVWSVLPQVLAQYYVQCCGLAWWQCGSGMGGSGVGAAASAATTTAHTTQGMEGPQAAARRVASILAQQPELSPAVLLQVLQWLVPEGVGGQVSEEAVGGAQHYVQLVQQLLPCRALQQQAVQEVQGVLQGLVQAAEPLRHQSSDAAALLAAAQQCVAACRMYVGP